MEIKDVSRTKAGNRFCGPAAISAIVGCTTDEAARVLRHVSGRRAIMVVSDREIKQAFAHFGVKMKRLVAYSATKDRPTLAGWLRESATMRSSDRVFLITAGQHWQIVSGRRYVCGRSEVVVNLSHYSVKKGSRVKAVFELTAPSGIQKPPQVALPPALCDDWTEALERVENCADLLREQVA